MEKPESIKVQFLSENAYMPKRGTRSSSGIDVFSPIDVVISQRSDALIPLDLRFEIPIGWDLAVYNKSGVSTKRKLDKGAELIDGDYRGNVHIHFFNHSDKSVEIKKGEKIAQLVMREVWLGDIVKVDEISTDTERATGGFGSTGQKA